MNALRTIRAALVPGGLVVDTQPVSTQPPVEAAGGQVGWLDMREWGRMIAAVDARIQEAVREGLFSIEHEERVVVTDAYDDGAEFVAVVRDWAGTEVGDALAQRAAAEPGPVRLHQEVRLRLLRAG